MKKYFLKNNVCIEPLILNWYAWIQLLSPITVGFNLRKKYLKILNSYLAHPELHQNANKDIKLKGGPYVNLNTFEMDKIKKLYEDILAKNEDLLKTADAIVLLNSLLEKEAIGSSLEIIYDKIPEVLAGCVELVYDMSHHPSIHFFESLFYLKYYNPSIQSYMLSFANADDRTFVMSTPRLENNDNIQINTPFASEIIDILSKARRSPCSLTEVSKLLNIEEERISTFFTEEKPSCTHGIYEESGVRIRYFGHACILIESKNISIMIDPLISHACISGPERYTFLDLPHKIDYVLISHSHPDHLVFETLLQIRHQVQHIIVPDNNHGFIADPSLKIALEHLGFKSVISLKELEKIQFEDGVITALPFLGEHGDLNIQTKLAYHILIKEKSLFFAADSNNLDITLYKMISKVIQPIDVLFIGMECAGAPFSWAYGPLFHNPIKRDFDQSRRLNGSDSNKAWDIAEILQCKEVIVYAMGQEPWLQHIMGLAYTEDSIQLLEIKKFLDKCKENGITAEKPYCKREWHY